MDLLNNIYSKICFTYILINLLNFNHQLAYKTQILYSPSNPVTDNLQVPNSFYPYLTKKCILGFSAIYSGTFPGYAEVTIQFSGALI